MRSIWQNPGWKGIPLLVLYGDDDQYAPPSLDKSAMVRSWEKLHAAEHKNGVFKILALANHEIKDPRY